MHQLTSEHLTNLQGDHKFPCISLYQTTNRCHPENLKDPICFRNLLKEMEVSLNQKFSIEETQLAMTKFQQLAHDETFWNHRTEGLAILCSPDTFQIFELQRQVPTMIVVADSFHTKPLLRILQSADRYQLLCLTREEANLYEGNRDRLYPVELTQMPATMEDALGKELTEPYLAVASYGSRASVNGNASHHGHGGKTDEIDIDTERFFRIIDRAILEHYSHPSGLPLILVALPEHQATFRALTHNTFLQEGGVCQNPESLSIDDLCEKAWQKVEPFYLNRLAQLVDGYHAASSGDLGSDDLAQVAVAAVAGRVASLLVEADRQVPGTIDATGKILPGEPSNPEVGDILDDLAETVLKMNGEVVIVPKERMPSTTGTAATFRY